MVINAYIIDIILMAATVVELPDHTLCLKEYHFASVDRPVMSVRKQSDLRYPCHIISFPQSRPCLHIDVVPKAGESVLGNVKVHLVHGNTTKVTMQQIICFF